MQCLLAAADPSSIHLPNPSLWERGQEGQSTSVVAEKKEGAAGRGTLGQALQSLGWGIPVALLTS